MEQKYLKEALKRYFLRNEGFSLEEPFQTLCRVEQKAMGRRGTHDTDFSPHLTARNKICKALLGNASINELFPEEDLQGTFEGDYDDQEWRELYYFAEPVTGSHNAREINLENPLYQAYRQTLYEKTIRQLCDDYPQEILQSLTLQEQEVISEQARKAAVPAVQPDFGYFNIWGA